MIPRRIGCVACAVLLTAAAGEASGTRASTKPYIDGLTAQLRHERVLVSFRVSNGLSEEALERIHSGIPVTFRHRVELLSHRSFPLPSKLISRTVIETRAEYDPLTKRYSLFRNFTFRPKKSARPPREQNLVTQTTDDVRAWMTEFADLPLDAPDLPGGRRLKVQVDSALGRRYVLLIFPGRISASAEYPLEP